MPKNLYLFDVSPFIHAGHVNKYSKLERAVDLGSTWKSQVTPTGGTSLLFNAIYEVIGTGDCVFCCDRNPTIKKDMLPEYKSNRDHKHEISVEKAVAEYILQKCGATVVARMGYEADDIIYTYVKKLRNNYDNIYIYTSDSDLYFLVDKQVSIRPSSSRGKYVDFMNYNKVLEKKGAIYNTIMVQKIIKGDAGDCVLPLPKDQQKILENVFYNEGMFDKLGNPDFVRDWINYVLPEAINQANIIIPLEVDDIPMEFTELDTEAVRNWGAAINNKLFRGMGEPDFDVRPFVEEMQNLGYFLEVVN